MGTTLLIVSGISLILIAVGILFGIGAFQAWRRWSNFVQHLVLLEASITDLQSRETIRGGNRSIGYFATYSYEYEGQNYEGEEGISKKHYSIWKQGMKTTIRIASNEPGNASLVAGANLLGDTALIWGFALAGLVCFVFASMIFWLV